MRQCCEYLRRLRYKLRMMGIPVDLLLFVFGDNQSVLYNTTLPDSTLKKKSLSISYHLYVKAQQKTSGGLRISALTSTLLTC